MREETTEASSTEKSKKCQYGQPFSDLARSLFLWLDFFLAFSRLFLFLFILSCFRLQHRDAAWVDVLVLRAALGSMAYCFPLLLPTSIFAFFRQVAPLLPVLREPGASFSLSRRGLEHP